jgi:prolyl oligopeptidase
VNISPDGSHLLVHVSLGWSRVDVHLLDRGTDEWRTVIKDVDALTTMSFAPSGLIGVTNLDAEKGRVVSAALEHPDVWTTIVAEGDDVIEAASIGYEGMFVTTLRSAVHGLQYRGFDGSPLNEIELTDRISFHGLDADRDTVRVFFQAEGFARPAALYRWTPEHGVEPWGSLPLAADPDSFIVEQVRYPSLDGTAIPMFLVRSARTTATADTPCILTGYGGFNIAETPAYGPGIVAWCERGGLYAIAGLRGGNEEGESWHRAGMRENKQNVFDDFHAAADWLVAQKLTSRDKLALRGGSNGGLLMGAAITQRPDLARAVHCAVPLLDMVRFHLFLIARLWIAEYGDPDVADEFAWLHAYSPYHHVEPACYPATLITTAEEDSRVDPSHARKMAAALQHASTCQAEHPILLRIEERAGHGQGKPVHKQADELADVLAFLAWQLGGPA